MKDKKYKTEFTKTTLEGLYSTIETLLSVPATDDDDKLLYAALAEIREKLYGKMYNVSTVSKMSFTPVQALALRILSTDYLTNKVSQVGNKLHLISNEVHQQYQ